MNFRGQVNSKDANEGIQKKKREQSEFRRMDAHWFQSWFEQHSLRQIARRCFEAHTKDLRHDWKQCCCQPCLPRETFKEVRHDVQSASLRPLYVGEGMEEGEFS